MALTAAMAASLVVVASPASADPADTCPPSCDRIPRAAWISPAQIPLDSVYSWPELANLAVTARPPRFRFEELCGTTPIATDPRNFAVAARSTVSNPVGQWQLQALVLHWRGETWLGGELAQGVFAAAVNALQNCQATNNTASPSLIVNQPGRIAASVSGPVILHEYLLVDPVSSTVTELALWSDAQPQIPWPSINDTDVLDQLGAQLCTAYLDSCP